MVTRIASILKRDWEIPDSLLECAALCEEAVKPQEEKYHFLGELNFLKVMNSFRNAGVRETHLHASFGYGYYDAGRAVLDDLFARIFGGEDGLVRHQFVSGTHALRCALFGLLRPGDEVLVVPNPPYDTLHPVFGLRTAFGSLAEWGIDVSCVSPGQILSGEIKPGGKTKVLFIQRSKGYAWQDSIPIKAIAEIIQAARSFCPEIKIIVDNCYGEFVEEKEPCDVGADLVAGSLIKNPGGGLALTGGYLVGKREAMEKAEVQLTAPGLGKAVGATLGISRNFFSGIFLAPQFVSEALKTAVFAAKLFSTLGYKVLPGPMDERTDTIQAIELGSKEKVLAFAQGIQSAGPLEQKTIPEGAPMAGYEDSIIMAGGTFVQGGSLELSCDAPLRPPYVVYLQGGLSSVHGKLGVLLAARKVLEV